MDLHALRQFLVVARLEHLSRAAAELRVAQPALSRTIARLEGELGTPLFDRLDRLRLNSAGVLFRDHVQRALGELDLGVAAVEAMTAAGAGTVALASESLMTLARPLATFKEQHPLVEIRLFQAASAAMVQQIRSREVDLCLLSQSVPSSDLETVDLIREDVLLATALNHPMAGRQSITVEELADQPIVTTRPGQWQRRLTDQLFAAHGLTPRIVCESDEPSTTAVLIGAGLGVGLLPAIARAQAPGPLAWLSIEDPAAVRTLRLAWHRNGLAPGAASLVRDHLQGWDWQQREPFMPGLIRPPDRPTAQA